MEAIRQWAKQHISDTKKSAYMYVSLDSQSGFFQKMIPHTFAERLDTILNDIKHKQVKQVRVITCAHNQFQKVFAGVESKHDVGKLEDWVCAFASPHIEGWERIEESVPASTRPIRCGLDTEEKKFLLSYARAVLCEGSSSENNLGFQKFFEVWKQKLPRNGVSLERFTQKATVDVVLWVNGALRGSQIVEEMSCLEALYNATRRAREDMRFKPVAPTEYSQTRIEITFMSELRLPLTKLEWKRNEIYPEKAYTVTVGSERGWYVPAVFNCRTFSNLKNFSENLLSEKVRTERTDSHGEIKVCDVIDFIENIDTNDVHTLRGPVLAMNEDGIENKEHSGLLSHVGVAMDYAVRIQDTDGSFPVIVSPFTIEQPRLDWVRSGALLLGMARALDSFPKFKDAPAYWESLERGYTYLSTYLYTHQTMDDQIRCATLLYVHDIAVIKKDEAEIGRSHQKIIDLIPKCRYNPILCTQIGVHLLAHKKATQVEKEMGVTIAEQVLADFDTKRSNTENTLDLASYADLPNLLVSASTMDGKSNLNNRGEEIFEWYMSTQNEDGSFPIRQHATYSYTRGTGKILEALSRKRLSDTDTEFIKALAWLHSMQYTKEGSYFVST